MKYVGHFEEDETVMLTTFSRSFDSLEALLDACPHYLVNSHDITRDGDQVRVQCECDGVTIVCDSEELAEKLVVALEERAEELVD